MSQISVISKLTGVETTTEGTQVTLGHSSIVKLNVDRADISGYSRSGNDLVITLHSGEVITLKNFYITDAQGVSQLVLEESDGALWWIEDPTGAATYESIASTDALLAASGSDTGGAAAWPWVLGGLAVAGGIAIAAGTGGGGGGDDDNNSPNPGNPGNPSEPDTTPPDAPTNLQVSPDGKTVTGTAEPGSTITLKDADGNTIGTGKAGSDGKFTIDLGTPLTNGEQITATATDPSGNTSQGGQVTAPDLTAPDAPANLEVSPDGKTVTGTAEPGSTVTLKDADGNTIGTGKAGSDGKFTIDLGTPLTNGEQITATATDQSGNTSPGVQVTAPDLTAPDAPEIVTVNDNVGAETGPLSNGQRTDDARPTFSGISEAGTVITFYDNGKPIGTATADATGKWSFTPSTNLSEGNHAITTTATDAAGNTSPASTAVTFLVDTVAPGAPAIVSITDDVAPGTGTLGSGSSTNDPRPQLTGTAEAGSTVTIYDNGIAIGTAVVGSNGSWSFTPSVNLSEGSHQLTVRATDVAGNTGPASPVFTVTVDVTAPQTPSGFIINDDTGVLKGAIGAGQFTDASEPRLTGRGEPGSTITVYDNGVVIGTTTVLPNGTWSITPTSPLAEGTHSITLRETDAAGNQSGLSQPINFTVDLTPPDMPVATLNSAGTQITGTAEPGSKIVITNNAGLQIGTATADSNGNYVANLNPAQTNGEIISVVASDAAGNQSSPALVNAADITPPAAPGNLVVAEDGASVSGTAEPNSTIIIKAPDGTIIGQATAGPDGTFTIPISPAQTNGEALEVTATDGSGNTSPSGFADAPDSTPPLAPENVVISADGTTVTGTAEPGSTVTIRENGVKVGEAVADDQGNFSVDLIPPKANGEALTADATDTAGNTGPTAPFDAPDITAAQTPVITGVVDDAPGVTGPVSQNGLTNDSTPTINGTGEPGTTITLYSGTTEIGTAVVSANGQWSITLETALPDGGHVLTATAVDANNNLSGTSNTWSITVDTAAPGAPAITQVIDDVPGRTGALDTNETTNDTLPTLNGTGEPGSTVTIRLDGQDIGTAVVNSGGAWTFTPTTPLVNGQHTFTVVASDAAGNASAPSAGFTFTVDTTPPPAATIDTVSDNVGPVQLPLNSGDTTDDTLPQLQGTAPDGTTITIYDGTTLLGTAVLDGSGGWSFTPTTPLTDGPHSLTVHATDEAGNTTISPPFELAIDTTAPATPDIPEITVNPDGGTPGTALNPGETTRDTTPTLSGSGTPGDTVNIYDGATKIGEAEIDGDGNWSWTPTTPLPDGTYDLSLTVTNQDSAGNESAPSTPVTITIDTDAPAQPGTPTVTDSVSQITGPVLDGESTNDPRPVLSGTGTPNDVITIYDQVGTGEPQAVGSVTVDGNGNWSWRPEDNIGEGTHEYTATATDEAGNESVPSAGITITVDTLAPDTPVISDIAGAQNGGSTNDTTPTLSGTGTTGETVIIYNNGVEVDRVEVVNGGWSYTLPTQTDGPLNITVAAVDDAGNVSPVSPVFTVEVDTQAPTVPQIDAVSDSQLTNSVLYTRDGTPTLTGIGEPGSSVTVSVDGVASPVVVEVQPNGTWSWTADPALTEGPHTFSVAASDAAGNTSASSGDLSVTVDTLPPATPTNITIAAEGTPLTGTADDGTTVTVRDANGNIIGTGVATGGNFSIALSPAQLDAATLTLIATDPAGNASPSTTFDVPDSPLELPAVPVITAINDDVDPVTGDVKDKTTNDTTPTLTGTADPGSVIAIYQDGSLLPVTTVVADTNGNWSYTPLLPLTEGPHTFAVTATNTTTGATSGQSPVAIVTVDLTAPTAPAIGAVTDDVGPVTGPIADGQSTNDNRPTLTGTGTAGDTITVYNNGDPLGTVVVGPTGTWSYTPPALDDGSHTLTVTATDPAGNESTPSAGIIIVVDTVSTTPVITSVTDNAGNAATPVPSGDPTNDTTPTLTGTAEPNSVVAIFDGATQIGTVSADGTGAWTFTPETALGEGTHDFTVRATDPQGNVSQPSGVWSINIDLTAPQVPTIDTVSDNAPGGVTGPLTAGQVTNDTTPTLSGTGQAGTTIHVLNNGVEIGTTTVDGNGNWSFTPDPVLTDGTYNLRVNASDDVGNVSANSPVFAFTVDTTGPAAPVVTTVIDDVSPGTGIIASNGSTNDTRPTFNGTGEVGATVHVIVDDVEIGTAVVNAQGNWTFTPTTALGEGPHTITFNATDAAGNTGVTSPPFNLTVDTSVPDAPVFTPATDNAGPVLGPVASGQSTDDTTPTLNGTAAANATITIYENGQQVGTAVADANGVWSFTTGTLANGSHTWTATATDAAGNVSPASPGFTLVVDTTAPAAPVITQAIDDVGTITGAIGSGQTTNDPLPRLVGTSEPLATVNIYEGTTLVGTGTADANGNWTVDITVPLGTGSHTFTAEATDQAGNTGAPSADFSLTIDTTPPALPVLTSITDDVGNAATPVANGGLTNDARPTLTGTAEAGATVTIYDNGVQIGTAVATGGAWSFTPSTPLADGPHNLTFSATDAVGNASAQTGGYTINVDATAPVAPAITSIVDDVGTVTGPVTGTNPTNDTRPTLNGTAEANATVRIYDGTTLVGTVTADANGNWTLPQTSTTLTEGAHNFTATATDAAGNTSAPSPIITINVDLTPPSAPTGLAVITNGTQVTGTAEAGSTVTITSSTGTVLGTAVADGSGNFSATLTPPQTGGESLIVFATDKAGNAGITTSVIAPITTIPNAPVIANIDDNVGTVTGNLTNGKTTDDTTPTLSGTAQPNATITLYNNGVLMGTVTANASGNWSFTTPVLSEGPHAFTATASNGSGTSPISTSTTVIVDLTAPTAPTGTFNADGSVLTGSAEAGSTVTIRLADNSTVTATADSNGSWSYTFLNKQTEGQTLQITATDAAGNVSLPGSALAPVVPLSASTNVEELALTTTATVTNSQYSDYGFLLVGAVGNVLTLLGNDTAQVGFTVGSGGSADIAVNANATGAVLSLLNTLELVVQRFDAANNTWTTVVDTGQPQFADLLTLGATGVSLNLTGLADGQYRVLSYNTNLLATGSYTSLDVAVKETSAGTVSGETSVVGNVITDVDPTAGSDNAPAGTTVTAVTNAQGTTTSVTADGTVIQGQYGTLTINLDGSYTYNLTNTSAAVIGRTENFTYTITHNGTSASANLVLSLGEGTSSSGIVAVDDTASLTFDTTVEAINNGTSSQGGFTLVGINLGNTLGLNLLDDLANPIIYNVEEGTTRTMTVQASVGGVALASVFDLYIYKFNNATQTFEQMRVEPGWLRAPLLGGTSSQLTLNLPAGEYLFLLNTAAGITALTAYTLNVLQDHVYSVASVSESTTGDVLADDIAPAGTVVSDVNGVAVNSSGLTEITGEYGTLRINAAGEYTYTLDSGVGADHISTPDTFVYTITAPDGSKDTASLNITPTARPMDAVNDVSTVMDVTSVHHTSTYTDTSVGTASWTTALLGSTQGSGSGTFVVDANTALHNASLHFNVASLLSLGGLTVNWSITDGTNVIRSGSFSGGSLLGGSIDVPLTGLDLNAGTYTLNFTGSVPGLSVGNITITPSVNGTTYSLSQYDATGTHTVDGNIFDGTGSAGAMDQLHSVDTRVSITGYDGVTTTLDPYTGSTMSNITGHYGTLAIAADGSYTYTLNPGISLSTITSKEVFNYTLTDASGATDTASLTIDMAPKFVSSEHNDVINGTAYGDTLIYQVLNNTAGNATAGNSTGDHWTNFSLTQGDKIDIGDLLVGWNGSASTLGNYVSVSQSGNNTVISIDRDGTGAAYTKSALVTLDNVQTTYDELVNQQHIIT
ncbi:TPA: BapA prefix-like domain-containing protein [Enterobacter hormaechei subsp. steigerwaltii]|uniref:BapA/Bap/LapF family large adhesin n=1 Tax=Enterobacter hormaechei TaxID=158836 RepID=UPI0013D2F11F|nr:BapA/Bap/LapF family large adhesin [Enterobacter hormaechei]MCU2901427.1 Ig-like domain-containing protein [Enterobacter hormaechei subsp. steigerwaltii]ELC0818747.1 BapA prefix-like domain-containing protein [Enterobacter hormaechei]MED5774655.1 Ig-like domain-containing protein [Enterobacter hormaechei]QQH01072.1 BapA prefix-like domain-containing protein [Enterobacter hormaechei]QQH06145.1 BapA prefix-like domain-containing protein [Enterobacter hormaechei]